MSKRVIPATRLVGVVSTAAGLLRYAAAPRRARVADLLELRLDLIPERQHEACLRDAAQLEKRGTPVLLTVRSASEGGEWRGDEDAREELYVNAGTSWVDVEVRSRSAARIAKAARGVGGQVVLSFHDFVRTPSLERLRKIVERCHDLGAHVAKVATTIRSVRDHETLLALLSGYRDGSLCVIGMGDLGKAFRLYAPAVGSALAYAYIDRATAPGQPDCASMAARLDEAGARA